jgi:hypothetical protein
MKECGPKVGERRALRVRRIGKDHVVVLPAQTATVVSVQDIRQRIRQANAQLQAGETAVASARAQLAELHRILELAQTGRIERDDNDPDVPQEDLAEAHA